MPIIDSKKIDFARSAVKREKIFTLNRLVSILDCSSRTAQASLNYGKPTQVTTRTANIILCLKFLTSMFMAYGGIKMSLSPGTAISKRPLSIWSLQHQPDFSVGSLVNSLGFCHNPFCIISAIVRASAEKSMTVFMSTSPMTLQYTKGRCSRRTLLSADQLLLPFPAQRQS